MSKVIDFFEYGPRYDARPIPREAATIIVLPIIRSEQPREFFHYGKARRRRQRDRLRQHIVDAED